MPWRRTLCSEHGAARAQNKGKSPDRSMPLQWCISTAQDEWPVLTITTSAPSRYWSVFEDCTKKATVRRSDNEDLLLFFIPQGLWEYFRANLQNEEKCYFHVPILQSCARSKGPSRLRARNSTYSRLWTNLLLLSLYSADLQCENCLLKTMNVAKWNPEWLVDLARLFKPDSAQGPVKCQPGLVSISASATLPHNSFSTGCI